MYILFNNDFCPVKLFMKTTVAESHLPGPLTLSSNLTLELPAMTAYVTSSSFPTLLMASECLFPSDLMTYFSLAVISIPFLCHFTLIPVFSVSASKTATPPATTSVVFGFLMKAEAGKKDRKRFEAKQEEIRERLEVGPDGG